MTTTQGHKAKEPYEMRRTLMEKVIEAMNRSNETEKIHVEKGMTKSTQLPERVKQEHGRQIISGGV